MAIGVYKTFSAGEVLTAADLNASLTQITNNGTDVAFPVTKNVSVAGFTLFFDAANTAGVTHSAKGVNLAGFTFNDAKTTVASAAAADIWTGTGHLIDYTGTTTATSFAAAPQAGASRQLLCAAAAPFTASANMLIDGYVSGSTYTAVAGDVVDVIAVTTTQFRLKPRPANVVLLNSNLPCQFRLTLTTAVPEGTVEVTGVATLYWSPYKGNSVALYDGSTWVLRTSAELSITNAGLSASKVYDVFVYDSSGTPTLELLAWTNDTARATALTRQDGVLVKTGATTRRYVGTIRTSAATTFYDALDHRWVWNYYNRLARPMRVLEATGTWNYTTATIRQANASVLNQLDFVIGVAEDVVSAQVMVGAQNTNVGVQMSVGIGLDSTSAFATGCLVYDSFSNVVNTPIPLSSSIKLYPAIGRHFLSWNEFSAATGTTTWRSVINSGQSGIHGEIFS